MPLGSWANAIGYLDAWVVGSEDGKSYLEEQLDPAARQWTPPIFITGDPEWSDYSAEVKVKPLNLVEMAGLAFRYRTNRHYYLFALSGGSKARLALHLPIEPKLRVHGWKELASADFPYDAKRYYVLKVETDGPRIRAYIDGKLILEANDSELLKGKAGVISSGPARFEDFSRLSAGRQSAPDSRKHPESRCRTAAPAK